MTQIPPFMGDFADDDVDWLIQNGHLRRVLAGEAIIREGEPLEHVFVILEGSFLVSTDQFPFPVRETLGRGEIAGELSWINKGLPGATVRAEVDSMVLAIARAKLDEKVAADEGFALRALKVVSEFTAERLYNWGKLRSAPPPPPPDAVANLRVYELIEKMLRGEFP